MVQLSFLEQVMDKASRLIPTAYMDIVEECTAAHLLIPTYEHVKFLCETVNRKPEETADVVRALRRRIADSQVAVKHLTIQLLESMIKNCSTTFHIEVAEKKGLLRDLVAVACMQPTTGRAMQAKEAALLLTLNLSIWFRGHPAEECYILTTLADDVRNEMGPNCFEGLEPQRNARVRVDVNAPDRDPKQSRQRSDVGHDNQRARKHGHHRDKGNIVDAIAINLPTSERVSAMLETCMAFSDYMNEAEKNPNVCLGDDEVAPSYVSQLRDDHRYVITLLSSNLQLDRDLLRTVSDSQSAVLAKAEKSMARPRAEVASAGPSASPPGLQPTLIRSAGDTEQIFGHASSFEDTGMQPRPSPPLAKLPGGDASVTGNSPEPVPTPPVAAAPEVEDLFGERQPALQATVSVPESPVPSREHPVSTPVAVAAESPDETVNAAEPSVREVATPAHTNFDATAPPLPVPAEAGKEDGVGAEEVPASLKSAVPDSAMALEGGPTSAPRTTDSPKDYDDFDAFLESHTAT
ncbi:hypothetical protein, conserved [Leishmania tarentolae]|uniref:VHS domain-containing protein n=1 Tax=Leishmania tarentolae TaxID=5689 RepID=A0A640KVP5_LEITA|nr:hypothetical protein, conserved [Leishmania tarentolae]